MRKIGIAICMSVMVSAHAMDFEVENGFVGMKRDVVLHLIGVLTDKPNDIRGVLGMCTEIAVWKNHRYFKIQRKNYVGLSPEMRGEIRSYVKSQILIDSWAESTEVTTWALALCSSALSLYRTLECYRNQDEKLQCRLPALLLPFAFEARSEAIRCLSNSEPTPSNYTASEKSLFNLRVDLEMGWLYCHLLHLAVWVLPTAPCFEWREWIICVSAQSVYWSCRDVNSLVHTLAANTPSHIGVYNY